MTSRQHLTPTPTVDKNGKVTTVYKKQSSNGSASLIPQVVAPSVTPSSDERMEFVKSLAERFDVSRYNGETYDKLVATMTGYSDEVLKSLDEIPDLSRNLISYSVINGKPDNAIREELFFFPYLSDRNGYAISADLVKSLHGYPRLLASEDFSSESDRVRDQALAILLVSDAVNQSIFDAFVDTRPMFILRDESLVEFVMEHADKVDSISAFILERQNYDLEAMSELIDSDATSLSSGML